MGAANGTSGARRIGAIDCLRGLTIISMVAFHATYDIAYIFGKPVPWFTEGIFQDVWRCSISWTFLFLAGWMTAHSRDNLKRGIRYALAALVVYAVTAIAAVDVPVTFGILFCMAASTLLYVLLERIFALADRSAKILAAMALIFLVLFALTYGFPMHTWSFEGLAWLGFPYPGFMSGDYYPLLPYGMLYLAASCYALSFRKAGHDYPQFLMDFDIKPLSAVGRLSLPIYLLHQPVIIAVLNTIFRPA